MSKSSHLVMRAGLVLLGTIIGAGVFGLPLMMHRVGFWPGTLLFWGLVIVITLTHLFFAEIVLHYRQHERLSGYVKKTIPGKWYLAALVSYPLQLLGATFAYLVLGGEFLSMIATVLHMPADVLTWQMLYWLGGAATVFLGLRVVAKVEVFATWFLIATLIVSTLLAIPEWRTVAFMHADWNNIFVPFGVFLFALSGTTIVPEIVELANYDRKISLRAIALGSIGSALLSYLFGMSLALALPDGAQSGVEVLQATLPAWASLVIPITGFLAVGTSFITVAQALKTTLFVDFGIEKRLAWTLTFFVPFVMLFITQRDFLNTIGTTGVLFGGVNGILIGAVAVTFLRQKSAVSKQWRRVLGGFAYAVPLVLIAVYFFGIMQKFFL